MLSLFLTSFLIFSPTVTLSQKYLNTNDLAEESFALLRIDEVELAEPIINRLNSELITSTFRIKIINSRLYASKGDLPKAFELLIDAFKSQELNQDLEFLPELYSATGYAYHKLGHNELSKKYFDLGIEKAIAIGDCQKAHEIRGEFGTISLFNLDFEESKKYLKTIYDHAKECIQKHSRIEQNLPRYFMNYAIVERALGHIKKGQILAQESLDLGLKLNDKNLPSLYITLGGMLLQKGDTTKVIDAYRKSLFNAIRLKQNKSQRMALVKISNLYSKMGMVDSVLYYLRKGEDYSDFSNIHSEDITVLLSKAHLRKNQMDSARLFALKTINHGKIKENLNLQLEGFKVLKSIHEKNGDQRAIQITNQNLDHLAKLSDSMARKLRFDELKVRLESTSKESQLAQLQLTLNNQRSKNNLLKLITFLSLLILILITRIWHIQRNRRRLEMNNIIISKRTVQSKLKESQQALVDYTIRLLKQKNTITDIEDIISGKEENEIPLSKLKKTISLSKKSQDHWDQFLKVFGNAHMGFFQRLKSKYPNITRGELKHCALIKMNLSIKESAEILEVSPKTVKMARYRLKKKLIGDRNSTLHNLLYSI